ncbi:hypothetical protein EUGRSUZ_G02944 [Eucalyptus grandis]|uniref:Uncharacterized protein n=2 Tax=Eucalyptus grandis TaxID=71139 RepID=A0ACC3K8B7_EUCGR|nr:hypothetical protein EUGRSUZ_G02944 [Eucalyptus grandis]
MKKIHFIEIKASYPIHHRTTTNPDAQVSKDGEIWARRTALMESCSPFLYLTCASCRSHHTKENTAQDGFLA